MNPISELHQLGQSLWYDNIQRKLLVNGDLDRMINQGDIRGITSNPSIFNHAIARSDDYDSALIPLARSGLTAEQIFYCLAVEDIQSAADLFAPLYVETHGGDGYVSLEVSPHLANDTQRTISEAKRLWELVKRPNLMIKIPATPEGIPAIHKTIAAGINVNVTLIFSLERYQEVMEAFTKGLEERVSVGLPINMVASVASFFISRLDSKVDSKLENIIKNVSQDSKSAEILLGKVAIANARLAYKLFRETTATPRFDALRKKGARYQRPLWASTSTKNPAYSDVIYINELIAPDTVNTVPPQTLEAFKDHGKAKLTLDGNPSQSRAVIEAIEDLGISLKRVTKELETEGVQAFKDAFVALLASIEERRQKALKNGWLNPLT
jgi:transaldolase